MTKYQSGIDQLEVASGTCANSVILEEIGSDLEL